VQSPNKKYRQHLFALLSGISFHSFVVFCFYEISFGMFICLCVRVRACVRLGERWGRDGGEKERNGGFLWLMFFCEQ
jgi:hypothetical protein